jgi:hypothetical protein
MLDETRKLIFRETWKILSEKDYNEELDGVISHVSLYK